MASLNAISVILPTFNRAHTLKRALASVFGQTRQPDEVIVVDDGSSDSTAEVVSEFPDVRFLRLEKNQGAAHARNVGIEAATGTYVAFLDSDDVWLTNKLEVQLSRMHAAPQINLLCTGITVLECHGSAAYHGFHSPIPAGGWTFRELQTYPFSPSTWLIQRSVLLEMGLFDDTMGNCEDLDFLAKMLGSKSIEFISEPLTVKYNQSDSLDASLSKTAASYEVLFSRYQHLWKKAPDAAANRCQRLADMYVSANQVENGRKVLLQTLGNQPWNGRLWGLLALSLFGRRVYLRGSGLLRL